MAAGDSSRELCNYPPCRSVVKRAPGKNDPQGECATMYALGSLNQGKSISQKLSTAEKGNEDVRL